MALSCIVSERKQDNSRKVRLFSYPTCIRRRLTPIKVAGVGRWS